jgi:hypothetical protein
MSAVWLLAYTKIEGEKGHTIVAKKKEQKERTKEEEKNKERR